MDFKYKYGALLTHYITKADMSLASCEKSISKSIQALVRGTWGPREQTAKKIGQLFPEMKDILVFDGERSCDLNDKGNLLWDTQSKLQTLRPYVPNKERSKAQKAGAQKRKDVIAKRASKKKASQAVKSPDKILVDAIELPKLMRMLDPMRADDQSTRDKMRKVLSIMSDNPLIQKRVRDFFAASDRTKLTMAQMREMVEASAYGLRN